MNDNQLKRAKKASAGLSITGGSLGLAGLGALIAKKPETAAKLSIGATGVGGVGSYNYAAIQRAEAKKRGPKQQVFVVRNKRQIKDIKSGLQPVAKGLDMLDFGLGSVVQPGEISKALNRKQQNNVENAAVAGSVAAPAGAYFGRRAGQGAQMGYQASRLTNSSIPKAVAAGAKNAGVATKIASDGGRMSNAFFKAKPLPLATAAIGGGLAASAGTKKLYQRQNQKKMGRVAKRNDWMNISEHERRARDSRRTRNRAKEVAGWGGAAVTGSVVHRAVYAPNRPDAGVQASRFARGLKSTAKQTHYSIKNDIPGAGKRAGQSLKGLAKVNPHGAGVVGGAALMAGGAATMVGARANEKRHDRAISRQRYTRVKKSENVFKAYNPEDRRRRRTERTSTAMAAAGGAGIAAGGALGKKSIGTGPTYQMFPIKGDGPKTRKRTNAGTGLRSAETGSFGFKRGIQASGFKGGLRTAGTGAALGLAGAGLVVGSDRMKHYARHGRGSSYRPLHRNI